MSTLSSALLLATLLAPLALLAACFVERWRKTAFALQWLAPLPGLGAGVLKLTNAASSMETSALGFTWKLDAPGALLLSVAALLWIVVSAAIRRDRAPEDRFGISWLLTMTGSLGVFVAGDLVSFYLFYALVSIPAYGLFALTDDPARRRAGAIYMAFAIFGETILLLAFAALATFEPHGSVEIQDAMAALPTSPWRDVTLALLVAGFGMKLGMVPFNGWMPLNYSMASIPVAAVLSGAGVKAGVIGLIRFLPEGAPLEGAGVTLAVLGCVSTFFGVVVGLAQKNAKTILAYSSISQMGVICAALGLAMREGAFASSNLAFYGLNHLLVKATLFLSVGAIVARRTPLGGLSLVLVAALALSLAGLPFTGGALAKLSVKPYLDGMWASALTTASSIGSAWLMAHFLLRLKDTPDEYGRETPATIVTYWPVIALGAILLPWFFYPAVGSLSKALEPTELWSALWPVAVGAGLALAQQRVDNHMPRIAPGDSIVVYERIFARLSDLGPALENLDIRLRHWRVTGVSFVLITLALLSAAILG